MGIEHTSSPRRTRAGGLAWVLLAALIVLTGCRGASITPNRPVTISIGGATAMRPVLQELAAEFTRRYPTVFFDLHGGGSRLGEEQARSGRFQLGASTLPPATTETASATETGTGPEIALESRNPGPLTEELVRIPIGIDALALIVHANNPVTNLSTEQIALIFSGRILNWSEVGGSSETIVLVSREEGSGARHIFEDRIMGREPVALTAVVMPTSADVVAYIAKSPTAIGYVSQAYIRATLPLNDGSDDAADSASASAPPADAVRAVNVDGVLPVDAAIQNQMYSLSYPIFLVSRREPTGTVRQFVDFALSPTGQTIIGRYHVRVR